MEAQSHRVSKGQTTYTHLIPLAPTEPVRLALVIINRVLAFLNTHTHTHPLDFTGAVNLASRPRRASRELMATS